MTTLHVSPDIDPTDGFLIEGACLPPPELGTFVVADALEMANKPKPPSNPIPIQRPKPVHIPKPREQ